MKILYPEGATPLPEELFYDLIPDHIATQAELNEWEAQNILEAENLLLHRAKNLDIMSLHFIKKLHQHMFGKTWKWAGKFRLHQTNIGIEAYNIQICLQQMLDNIFYLQAQGASIDKCAARLHHQLVWIHPFPNGNGRHARLFADLYLIKNNQNRFSWGRKELVSQNETRKKYLAALRSADRGDFKWLEEFVRS